MPGKWPGPGREQRSAVGACWSQGSHAVVTAGRPDPSGGSAFDARSRLGRDPNAVAHAAVFWLLAL